MPKGRRPGTAPESQMAAAHPLERREPRYAINIEIAVSGIDQNGDVFHERAVTTNVSEWGCAFLLSVELRQDDILALHLISSDKAQRNSPPETMFQVMRVIPEGDLWFVGTWKMDAADVWGSALETAAEPKRADFRSLNGAGRKKRRETSGNTDPQ
jgi:hypothetical protein